MQVEWMKAVERLIGAVENIGSTLSTELKALNTSVTLLNVTVGQLVVDRPQAQTAPISKNQPSCASDNTSGYFSAQSADSSRKCLEGTGFTDRSASVNTAKTSSIPVVRLDKQLTAGRGKEGVVGKSSRKGGHDKPRLELKSITECAPVKEEDPAASDEEPREISNVEENLDSDDFSSELLAENTNTTIKDHMYFSTKNADDADAEHGVDGSNLPDTKNSPPATGQAKARKRRTRVESPGATSQSRVCATCGRVFKHACLMRLHLRSHTGEKPYACPHCDKRFAIGNQLNQHMVQHSDKRPFRCEKCDAAFKYKHILKAHRRIHTGERAFKCALCDKAYVHRSALRAHKLAHMGNKEFKCTLCDKAYAFQTSLNDHMKRHREETLYKCQICGRKYLRIQYLEKHLSSHKNVSPEEATLLLFSSTENLTSQNLASQTQEPLSSLQSSESK